MNIALEIPFFTLSNIKINFTNCHFYWKTFTITKTLLTIRQLELIEKKEFTTTAFDLEDKVFIVHIASISRDLIIHSFWRALIALLKANETSTFVLSEYADFANVFYKDLTARLLKYIVINDHTIDLIKNY